jgi:CxxC motif-containing protein (DUF1111 family)
MMRIGLLLILSTLAACEQEPKSILSPLAGGDATVFDVSEEAFGHPSPILSRDEERAFFRGRALFRDVWVMAPASTDSRDGLGPLFNARSCEACHARDGRGAPPARADEALTTMLLRLSIPGQTETGAPLPHPNYGGQLQPLSLPDVPREGQAFLTYAERDDGLLMPSYEVKTPGYGPLDGVLMSPRVAPHMVGLGLLANIPEALLLEKEDPSDADGDGISGRANRVWDVSQNAAAVGRFGWKANQPSLRQQVAGAFLGDIGMTSSLFGAEDCTAAQSACLGKASGGQPELSEAILFDVTFYSETLAVPARRMDANDLERGEALFFSAGCDGCHTPTFAVDGQTIQPFSDLLLHDMGDALADGRPDFQATGNEWRTPPLWGLGLIEVVNGHMRLLHDGRARGVSEAILWHGGEAERSAAAFREMNTAEKQALEAFILSL